MRVLALFSIAVAAEAAATQPLSFSRTEIPVGGSCCSLGTADFNGDGKPDLAAIFGDNLGAGGSHLLVLWETATEASRPGIPWICFSRFYWSLP